MFRTAINNENLSKVLKQISLISCQFIHNVVLNIVLLGTNQQPLALHASWGYTQATVVSSHNNLAKHFLSCEIVLSILYIDLFRHTYILPIHHVKTNIHKQQGVNFAFLSPSVPLLKICSSIEGVYFEFQRFLIVSNSINYQSVLRFEPGTFRS